MQMVDQFWMQINNSNTAVCSPTPINLSSFRDTPIYLGLAAPGK